MAFQCAFCMKKRLVGNKVSHSNIKTKTVQRPNLQRVHAIVDGVPRHVRVCTRCLRSGVVVKAA
ncbi:MAG TPA: 50S ribosomal protein L28 [Haliangiales bacterium]|nr:50S ribosomal protein L28 [Haliangiales bacterium]